MVLKEKELKEVNGGGGFSVGLFIGISTFLALFSGFLDGFTRPFKCR